MSEPATNQSRGRATSLRLLASVSQALHSLNDDQLRRLPNGQIELNVRAICESDTQAPWARFRIDGEALPPHGTTPEEDWVPHDTDSLLGLHEWIILELQFLGVEGMNVLWSELSSNDRRMQAHSFLQLLDPMQLLLIAVDSAGDFDAIRH
jgi:hypothetical protein